MFGYAINNANMRGQTPALKEMRGPEPPWLPRFQDAYGLWRSGRQSHIASIPDNGKWCHIQVHLERWSSLLHRPLGRCAAQPWVDRWIPGRSGRRRSGRTEALRTPRGIWVVPATAIPDRGRGIPGWTRPDPSGSSAHRTGSGSCLAPVWLESPSCLANPCLTPDVCDVQNRHSYRAAISRVAMKKSLVGLLTCSWFPT